MVMKFTNNATSTLAAGINNSVTTLSVAVGQGALFPTLSGDYFYCTLANVAGTVEIIKVTARSTDTFTIVRGQDNTSAASWIAGDKVELRLVAASLNDLPKLDEDNIFTGSNTYQVMQRLQRSEDAVAALKERLSGEYVYKEDYRNDIKELKDMLRQIFDKLDNKQDK